jgi:hypothetical protein
VLSLSNAPQGKKQLGFFWEIFFIGLLVFSLKGLQNLRKSSKLDFLKKSAFFEKMRFWGFPRPFIEKTKSPTV